MSVIEFRSIHNHKVYQHLVFIAYAFTFALVRRMQWIIRRMRNQSETKDERDGPSMFGLLNWNRIEMEATIHSFCMQTLRIIAPFQWTSSQKPIVWQNRFSCVLFDIFVKYIHEQKRKNIHNFYRWNFCSTAQFQYLFTNENIIYGIN